MTTNYLPAEFEQGLLELLQQTRDDIEIIHPECSCYYDDFLEEYAYIIAKDINADMRKYLHMNDHRIAGNFNNIETDYSKHLFEVSGGKYGKDDQADFAEMVQRLDNNEQSERAEYDRAALASWFWDTFGTFGITYNYQNLCGEYEYEYEREQVEA